MISPYVFAGLKPCTEDKKIETILSTVAQICGVDKDAAAKGDRGKNNIHFRHISTYIIRQHTDLSLKKIGKLFCGKDHATVINSIQKVQNALQGYDTLLQERALEAIEILGNMYYFEDKIVN